MTEAAVNLKELVASERDRVLRFCRSKIRDKAEAEDVAQEIFVKFAQEMANSAKPIREAKAWLTRVAENACADYGRRLVKRLKRKTSET
jgi:RNA polymerase sigma factor (sigma-70 family)